MKKFLTVMLTLALVLVLSSCGKSKFFDGTFTAQSDKREHGWEEADVVFKNNKIVSITLRRMDAEGKEVDYSEWTGESRPNLNLYRKQLAEKMMEANNPTKVDTIAGATESSRGWIQAVDRAIEKARK